MREIKFRAWIKKGVHRNRMLYQAEPDPDEHITFQPRTGTTIYYDYDDIFYPDVVLMQFTGLTDKNGVDIYEGDIVKYYDSYKVWLLASVIYEDGCFSIKHPSWDDDILLRDFIGQEMEGIEVVGNIYENSDLLENRG